LNQHLTGNLDNWDPAILDGIATEREIVLFNNAGVASSTGPTLVASGNHDIIRLHVEFGASCSEHAECQADPVSTTIQI
jgi:hypothetical protein